MDKNFIFKGNGTGNAVIKNGVAQIKLYPAKPLHETECFEVFSTCKGKLVYSGKLCDTHGSLNADQSKTDALLIIKTGKNAPFTVEMWGECVNGEEFFEPGAKLKKNCNPVNISDKKTMFTFENFLNLNFLWQKIGSFVTPYNYDILHHVMSSDNVYRCVNRFGHYMFGEASKDGVLYFAVAVPFSEKTPAVFAEFKEKTYTITEKNTRYTAICMGVDESGEFFVCL